jgi:hypothetical protein
LCAQGDVILPSLPHAASIHQVGPSSLSPSAKGDADSRGVSTHKTDSRFLGEVERTLGESRVFTTEYMSVKTPVRGRDKIYK